ncbi:MAG: DUF4423 domain-containing protein [Bdellovibrionota bacterium]
MRAFARQLDVSPAILSLVLNGKKSVTLNLIEKTGLKLDLSLQDIGDHQLDLIREKSGLSVNHKSYDQISEDRFNLIQDWYHYAILNLMRTKNFVPSAKWISKRLSIPLMEVQSAIERLQRVNLLKISKNKWEDLSNKFTTHVNDERTSEARKRNQIQFLEKSVSSIKNIKLEERDNSGLTLAIKTKDINKMKKLISRFRKQFHEQFDTIKDGDEVYQLSVALFPLTDLTKK